MARKKIEERIQLTNNERLTVYIDCQNKCAHCGKHLHYPEDVTIDHVVPLNKGGRNELRNFVTLCKPCNLDKSDDVVCPMDYYPYLPEKKKSEVEAVFEEYIESVPWFAHDNLFMLDRFDLKTAKVVYIPKQNKCYPIQTTMRVEKTSKKDAFDYLQLYIARLQPEDKALFAAQPNELNAPYYKVFDQRKCVMLIAAFVDQYANTDRNMLRLDFFPNPEIKARENVTEYTLAEILNSLLKHIQDTLMQTARNTMIDVLVSVPQSDKLGDLAAQAYASLFPQTSDYFESPLDGQKIENGGTTGVKTIMYQGTTQEMLELTKKHNLNSLHELREIIDKIDLQKPLDQALEEAGPPPMPKQKPVHHKNDAKRHARKKHKRK